MDKRSMQHASKVSSAEKLYVDGEEASSGGDSIKRRPASLDSFASRFLTDEHDSKTLAFPISRSASVGSKSFEASNQLGSQSRSNRMSVWNLLSSSEPDDHTSTTGHARTTTDESVSRGWPPACDSLEPRDLVGSATKSNRVGTIPKIKGLYSLPKLKLVEQDLVLQVPRQSPALRKSTSYAEIPSTYYQSDREPGSVADSCGIPLHRSDRVLTFGAGPNFTNFVTPHDEHPSANFKNQSQQFGSEPKAKRPWTEHEDAMLRSLVDQLGQGLWAAIAAQIPGRSGKQVRERWLNHLSPNVTKRPWSLEEDDIIIESHGKYGNCWSRIAKLLDGRSDNSVKNRFYTTLRRRIARPRKMERRNGAEFSQSNNISDDKKRKEVSVQQPSEQVEIVDRKYKQARVWE